MVSCRMEDGAVPPPPARTEGVPAMLALVLSIAALGASLVGNIVARQQMDRLPAGLLDSAARTAQ